MFDENYLLNKKVKLYQPQKAYHASSDAVWLAAAVKSLKKESRVLDVGSGTGAVSLCLAHRFKELRPQILGLEIQKILTEAASLSAKENSFDFVRFLHTDIFKAPLLPCSFDYVVTNPPYDTDDMPSPNSSKATAHTFEKEGLKKWVDFCIKMLKPHGNLCLIHRTSALEDLLTFFHGRLGALEIFPLCSKINQPAKRIVLCAEKDSKAPLVLHPEILVHHEDGSYTEKAQSVLREGLSL